jgi:predicted permease
MIRNYFNPAWRSLIHNPRMTALNMAGLTVGMTAAALIFLWVQNEWSFDRYQPDARRVYAVGEKAGNGFFEGVPMQFAAAARKGMPGIVDITRVDADNHPIIEASGQLEYADNYAYVDPNWFDFFSYSFIDGNSASFARNPYGLVLTRSEAQKYFSNQPAVGRTIRIDSMNFTVGAVISDPLPNSSFQYSAYLPIAALETNPERRQHDESWDNSDFRTFIRLAPNARPATVTSGLTKVLQQGAQDNDHALSAGLTPLTAMHFDHAHVDGRFGTGNAQVVTIFAILGFLILLVACINYVNLTTAKASLRSKEVSIRKIVGAARIQLFWQFAAESALLSGLSLAASLLLMKLCLPAFAQLTGKDFTGAFGTPLLWEVMGSTLAAAFILNSIYPALLLSSFNPLNIFRGVTILRLKDVYLRKGLVVLQFTVAILLITATVVIERQLQYIQSTNPGYDRSQVMTVSYPNHVGLGLTSDQLKGPIRAIEHDLRTNSGIEAVSMASQPVVNIGSRTSNVDWDGKDTSFRPQVGQLSADAEMQDMLKLHMAAGHWFRAGDLSDDQNYILNETAVTELHLRRPVIGARFSLHGAKGTIVGVVKDFHFRSMHEKTPPLVIFNDPGWWQYFYVKISPGHAATALAAVQEAWKRYFPGAPLQYSFLDEQFDHMYRQDSIAGKLILLFAAVAVVLSSLGLFGLAAFAAERRRREIGIRKVLGASTLSLGSLVSKDFVRLVAVAILVATPLAWWATNTWLQGFAYRIHLSWWMFALSGILELAIALLITGWQALRAAWQNPVRSLRVE